MRGQHPIDESQLPELVINESRGDVIRKRWAFCPITGDLLVLDAAQGVARSERAPFSRPLSDLDETMLVVTLSDMADYQRRYALDPLIKSREQLEFEEILRNRVRATVEEPCPRCKAPIMEYHTMQLRSADEGQVGGVWGDGGVGNAVESGMAPWAGLEAPARQPRWAPLAPR
jgi:DNA-directed RNA polymerase I subunit RPA12